MDLTNGRETTNGRLDPRDYSTHQYIAYKFSFVPRATNRDRMEDCYEFVYLRLSLRNLSFSNERDIHGVDTLYFRLLVLRPFSRISVIIIDVLYQMRFESNDFACAKVFSLSLSLSSFSFARSLDTEPRKREGNEWTTTRYTRPMVRMVGQTLIARCVSANISARIYSRRVVHQPLRVKACMRESVYCTCYSLSKHVHHHHIIL